MVTTRPPDQWVLVLWLCKAHPRGPRASLEIILAIYLDEIRDPRPHTADWVILFFYIT